MKNYGHCVAREAQNGGGGVVSVRDYRHGRVAELDLPDSQIVPESSQSLGDSVIVSLAIISLIAEAST